MHLILMLLIVVAVALVFFDEIIVGLVKIKDAAAASTLASAIDLFKINSAVAGNKMAEAVREMIEWALPPILRFHGWTAFGLFLTVGIGGTLMASVADQLFVGVVGILIPGILCAVVVLLHLLPRWPSAIRRVMAVGVVLSVIYGTWIMLAVSAWIHQGHAVDGANYGVLHNGRPFVALGFLVTLFGLGTISLVVAVALKIAETLTSYLEGTSNYLIGFVQAVFAGGDNEKLANAFTGKVDIANQEKFFEKWKEFKRLALIPLLLLYLLPQMWPSYDWNSSMFVLMVVITAAVFFTEGMKVPLVEATRQFVVRAVFWAFIVLGVIHTIFILVPGYEKQFDTWMGPIDGLPSAFAATVDSVWWFIGDLTMLSWVWFMAFIAVPAATLYFVMKLWKTDKGSASTPRTTFVWALGAMCLTAAGLIGAKAYLDQRGAEIVIDTSKLPHKIYQLAYSPDGGNERELDLDTEVKPYMAKGENGELVQKGYILNILNPSKSYTILVWGDTCHTGEKRMVAGNERMRRMRWTIDTLINKCIGGPEPGSVEEAKVHAEERKAKAEKKVDEKQEAEATDDDGGTT